jgi:para-aminobenzoate synthetase component I
MALDLHILPVAVADPDGEHAVWRWLTRVAEATEGDYGMLHWAAGAGATVLGFGPLCRVCVNGEGVARVEGLENMPAPVAGQPLEALAGAVESVRFAPPHALVGWLGCVSYEVGRFLEPVPAAAGKEGLRWPVVWFTLFRHYVVIEGGRVAAYDVVPPARHRRSHRGAGGERAPAWELLRPCRPPPAPEAGHATIVERPSRAVFEAKVRRVKEYLAAGDIYQANVAQRWVFATGERAHEVFRRLCDVSPAPYAACLRFHDGLARRHVVSASPELFLTLSVNAAGERIAVTRPIKGTRPRDPHDAARDEALRRELLASAKDHAELTMIVDLLRNDLGRVARYGSVRVVQAREIERHPTVWHTVATIEGRLRREAGLAEVLRALCPGGSITGAPKIRAMQIIEELEGFRRGIYCGNIGVIGPQGKTLALNIAIRTLVMQAGRAYAYAGGGIVADSDPGAEYEETLHKAAAMLAALGCPLGKGER